jgi:hypothetical protein
VPSRMKSREAPIDVNVLHWVKSAIKLLGMGGLPLILSTYPIECPMLNIPGRIHMLCCPCSHAAQPLDCSKGTFSRSECLSIYLAYCMATRWGHCVLLTSRGPSHIPMLEVNTRLLCVALSFL